MAPITSVSRSAISSVKAMAARPRRASTRFQYGVSFDPWALPALTSAARMVFSMNEVVAVVWQCDESTVASGLEKTELAAAVEVAHGQEGGVAYFGTAFDRT